MSVDELVDLYDTTLLNLLNKHCPAVKMRRRYGAHTPRFDAECRSSRRHSRMLKRRYRRTRSNADRLLWIRQLKKMHRLYEEKNNQLWRIKIADNKGNTKKRFRTLSGIMGNKTGVKSMMVCSLPTILPSFSQTRSMQSEQRHPPCLCKMFQSLQSMSSIIGHW